MASLSALVLVCILPYICSLQTEVMAKAKPKNINLTLYLQEIQGGPRTKGTIFPAAGTTSQGNNATAVGWGTIFIFDSPLHEGKTQNTTLLGKSTETTIVTNKGGIPDGGVQVNSQHIFGNRSRYYKSSFKVEGMVDFTSTPPYECIVPRGTGYFRVQGLRPCSATDVSIRSLRCGRASGEVLLENRLNIFAPAAHSPEWFL